MLKRTMEDVINEVFTGDLQRNALDLAAYLKENQCSAEDPGNHMWDAKYKDEVVCFIHFVVPEYNPEYNSEVKENERNLLIYSDLEQGTWVNWTDSEKNDEIVAYPVDERIKKIAWSNLRTCTEECSGPCKPGMSKRVLGKTFNNLCFSALMFSSLDKETLECVKRMIDAKISDIVKKSQK
ncbi:MAG: hypothetical protein FWC32_01090 [Firmicutes bacterium]|nr:hypothetical protein [Bacillota bacterium]